jgi:tryptophan-rich sensory protein
MDAAAISSTPRRGWLATPAGASLELLAWLAACMSAGLLGAVFTFDSVRSWYPTIAKPAWTPPSWLFGPVWTTLYLMMGVAAWRVARRRWTADVRRAVLLFVVQLLLNAAWSPLFFGARLPGIAFGEILLLWSAIVLTIAWFWRIDRLAAALLVPYLAWVSFASALNGSIWWLNRGA